jgi:NitT/TauT family transport system substrate-binding protein
MDVLLRGFVLKQEAALDPDLDLTLVPMPVGNMNAALESHAVDAAFSWEPFVSQAVLRGSARVLYDVNQALPGFPWYVVMAPARTLAERPGDVVKLLRAHHLAVLFLNEHQEESDALIAEAFSLAAISRSDGVVIPPSAIVTEARKRLAWSDRLEPADLAFIQRLIGYSISLGFITGPLQFESIVDLSFQKQALP